MLFLKLNEFGFGGGNPYYRKINFTIRRVTKRQRFRVPSSARWIHQLFIQGLKGLRGVAQGGYRVFFLGQRLQPKEIYLFQSSTSEESESESESEESDDDDDDSAN